jgi:hypothetical protein
MSNKFGSLLANVTAPFKVELIYPATDQVIRDKNGKAAYIAVWSTDSARSRDYDKSKRKDLFMRAKASRTGAILPDDPLDQNIAKCAALTDSWYLVDPVTLEAIDVPCTPENAVDLYASPGAGWIFIQPWTEASATANFLQSQSKDSSNTPDTTSD